MLFFPLVFTAQHSCWTSSYNISSFLGPFYSLGIFGPFHFLGILGPFHSFLLLTFPWAFAKSFGLPWPNYHILYPWVYWPSNQSHLLISFFGLFQPLFYFLSISYDSHGLTTSSFRASLARLLSLGATLLFCRPVDHYSCHSSPMVFTLLVSFSTFFILLGFFYH